MSKANQTAPKALFEKGGGSGYAADGGFWSLMLSDVVRILQNTRRCGGAIFAKEGKELIQGFCSSDNFRLPCVRACRNIIRVGGGIILRISLYLLNHINLLGLRRAAALYRLAFTAYLS